jgi:hypothetical protein
MLSKLAKNLKNFLTSILGCGSQWVDQSIKKSRLKFQSFDQRNLTGGPDETWQKYKRIVASGGC